MIIAISGKMQHGKNTVATIIQYLIWTYSKHLNVSTANLKAFLDQTKEFQERDSGFQIKAFADKLKDIVCLLLGCTKEQLEDNDFKERELGEEWDCLATTSSWNNVLPLLSPMDSYISTHSYKRKLTPRLLLQLLGTECGRKIIHPNIWVNALMSDYETPDLVYPHWIITDCRFPNEAAAVKSKQGLIIRVHRPGMSNDDKHESETALDSYQSFDAVFNNVNGDLVVLLDQVQTYLLEQQVINKWK